MKCPRTRTSLGSSDALIMMGHIYLNVSMHSVNFPLFAAPSIVLVSIPMKTKSSWVNSTQNILLTNLLMFSKPFKMIPSNKKPKSFALMLITSKSQSMPLRESLKKLIKTMIISNRISTNLLTLNIWKKYKKTMNSTRNWKDPWIPSKTKLDWSFPSKMIFSSWRILWSPLCWSAFPPSNGPLVWNSTVQRIS